MAKFKVIELALQISNFFACSGLVTQKLLTVVQFWSTSIGFITIEQYSGWFLGQICIYLDFFIKILNYFFKIWTFFSHFLSLWLRICYCILLYEEKLKFWNFLTDLVMIIARWRRWRKKYFSGKFLKFKHFLWSLIRFI